MNIRVNKNIFLLNFTGDKEVYNAFNTVELRLIQLNSAIELIRECDIPQPCWHVGKRDEEIFCVRNLSVIASKVAHSSAQVWVNSVT